MNPFYLIYYLILCIPVIQCRRTSNFLWKQTLFNVTVRKDLSQTKQQNISKAFTNIFHYLSSSLKSGFLGKFFLLFLLGKHCNILQSFQLKFFKINITFSTKRFIFNNVPKSRQANDVECTQIPRTTSLVNWSSVSCSHTVMCQVCLTNG